MTVKLHATLLPEASVEVEVTVVVPTGNRLPEAGRETTVAEQLSVVLTVKFTIAPQTPGSVFRMMLAGHVIVGGSTSLTMTVKLQVVLLPAASVEVEFTVVVPTGKNDPEAGTDTTVAEQLSVVVTEKNTVEPQSPGVAFMLMFAGQEITGGSTSLTMTVKLHVVLLPAASVEVELTVVVPIGKNEPDAGVVTSVVEQLSVLVTV
jgi:hypothetical protein